MRADLKTPGHSDFSLSEETKSFIYIYILQNRILLLEHNHSSGPATFRSTSCAFILGC
jgi:hypothetical protein